MINIKRDVQDPYYRYKMPRIQCKIEGKGNGIKTVFVNLADVGKALARPPSYVTKFFGAEVGALSQVDDRTQKYLVNGVHDQEKLQSLLDVFILKFVLCPACENPETVLKVSKKDATITRTCQACGNRALVDMQHKLVSYIRANPPPKAPSRSQAKDRSEEAQKAANADTADSGSQDGPAPEVFEREIDTSNIVVDEDDWAEEEAENARQNELARLSASVRDKLSLDVVGGDVSGGSGSGSGSGGKEQQQQQHHHQQIKEMELIAMSWSTSKQPPSDDEILAVADKLESTELTIILVIQVLLKTDSGPEAFMASLIERIPVLQRLSERQDYSSKFQRSLLGSLERVVLGMNGVDSGAAAGQTATTESLLPALNSSLQLLYNADVVEEDALLGWKNKPSKRFIRDRQLNADVRKACEPFFAWLEEAEESE